MKFPLSITIILLTSLITIHADTFISQKKVNKIVGKGATRICNVQANKIMIDGCLAFTNVEVNGDLTITCPICGDSSNLKCKNLLAARSVIARNVKCDQMHILGSVQLENLEMSGDATIAGNVKIKNGKLNNLNSSSNETHLHNVKLNDIIIEEPRIPSQNQFIHLKGNTLVAGDINFKSGHGVVFMDNDAKINGKITGPAIDKQEIE